MSQILIVEDTKDIRALYKDALGGRGHQVLEAKDAKSAIKLLKKHTPDLAVVDLQLPGDLGTRVIEYIRSQPRLAGCKIVVVTANPQMQNEAESIGTDLFLIKPIIIGEFLDLIDRLTR